MLRQLTVALVIVTGLLQPLFRLTRTETVPSIPNPPTGRIVFETLADGSPFTVKLTCGTLDDTSTANNQKRAWTRDVGDVIPLQSIQNDGSLMLEVKKDVQATKAGVRYQCIAGNSIGKIRSSSAVLTYAQFDTSIWDQPSGTIIGYVDNQVLIPCTVPTDAQPVPTVAWYRNGAKIDVDADTTYTLVPSGNLYIYKVQSSMDNDTFFCQITNYEIFSDVNSTVATLEVRPRSNAPLLKPTIIVQPKDTTTTQGQDAYLEVSAIGDRTITNYGWSYQGPLSSKPPIALVGESTAKISGAYEGQYLCYVTYETGGTPPLSTTASNIATITVNVPPTISTEIASEIVVHVGYPFSLECVAAGKPVPTVTWYQNADSITSGDGSATYAVSAASYNDHSGMYQCFANNEVGEAHKTTRIIVRNATMPNVTISPSHQAVADPGQSVHTCVSHADPAAAITWFVNGTEMTSDIENTVSGLKTTSEFTYKFDSGMLAGTHTVSCMALNIRGNVTAESTVDIQVEVFVHEMASDQKMYYERLSVVTCPYVSFPAPKAVSWTHEGTTLVLKNSRYSLTDVSTLNIGDVTFDDAGEYCCTLTNEYGGTDYEASGCANTTVDAYPMFTSAANSTTVRLNRNTALVCSGFGIPVPTIRWTNSKGAAVTAGVTTTTVNNTVSSTLEITNAAAAHGGEYYCYIRSSLSEVNSSFIVYISNATDPPPATIVPKPNYDFFPVIAIVVPVGILVLLVVIIACVQCRKRGSYDVSEEPNIKPFHVRAERNDQGELYAEAGPDIIQQRRRFLQEQAPPGDDLNGQYATIGSKRSSTLTSQQQSPTRPAPPYPGRAAPPYPHKEEGDENGNGGSFI